MLSRKLKITFKNLGGKIPEDFEIIVYHDASFGNLPAGGSQGGIIVYAIPKGSVTQEDFYNPRGKVIEAVPLYWRSFRLQRVARSTFAGETLCASEALDIGQFFRECLSEITGTHIPVSQITDCKSLKDNVDSIVPKSTEKRLKRDLHAIREAVLRRELQEFMWADTRHQMADALTKEMDATPIIHSFSTGTIKIGMSEEQATKAKKLKKKQANRASRVSYWKTVSDYHNLPKSFFSSELVDYLFRNL